MSLSVRQLVGWSAVSLSVGWLVGRFDIIFLKDGSLRFHVPNGECFYSGAMRYYIYRIIIHS